MNLKLLLLSCFILVSMSGLALSATTTITGKKNPICSLPKQSGPCEAYIENYFYNAEAKECQMFIYGGS